MIESFRPIKIFADGFCSPQGHAGWGVLVYSQKISCYSGHIFTGKPVAAKKVAFSMAMLLAPAGDVVHLFTSCREALNAYEGNKPIDYFDEEIQRIKELKKLLLPVQCESIRVRDATILARQAAIWKR